MDADVHRALVGPDGGDDDVGAGRQHRAGGHLQRQARPDGGRRAGAGDALPHDGQPDRLLEGGRGDVLGPGGVAVERGLVEGGQRTRADDLLRAEQALGVEDRELDRVRLRNGGEDLVEVPLDGADLREPLRQLHG